MTSTSFLDSNVIVYAFTNNPQKEKCRKIIKEEELSTNTLVLVESYSKIKTITDKKQADDTLKMLYRLSNIKILNTGKNLFFESLKRTGKYRLKISDLIHYTTALLNNCNKVLSYDKHFDNLELKREEP